MSAYRDRVGQRIGSWTVVSDHGRSVSGGKVLWRLKQDGTGDERILRTEQVIKLDRGTSKSAVDNVEAAGT